MTLTPYDKAQGIISGAVVTLARNPLTNLEAATKGYVDTVLGDVLDRIIEIQNALIGGDR